MTFKSYASHRKCHRSINPAWLPISIPQHLVSFPRYSLTLSEKSEVFRRRTFCALLGGGKGKGFPYSLPSTGPETNSSVQADNPEVDCHYFPPGLQLPSQPQSITAPWPVPSYTAWWQRHIGVNNVPKVVTQLLPQVGFEPTTCWSQVQHCTHCATAIVGDNNTISSTLFMWEN